MSSASSLSRMSWDYFDRSSLSSGWAFRNSSTHEYVSSSETRTDTVKRAFPLDRFASATVFTRSTTRLRDVGYDWVDGSGLRLYSGYPTRLMYPSGQSYYANRAPADQTLLVRKTFSISRESMYNQIRANLRNEAFNLAQNLGEYAQTAKLFRELAQVVTSRGKSLLRRHPGVARARRMVDIPSSAANAHLQFQYGIRPLASDLGVAIGVLQTGLIQKPLVIEGRVSRRERFTEVGYQSPNSTIARSRARVEIDADLRYKTTYRAYLNRNVLLSNLSQFGLTNPAALAWELMPYSFVIDWFVNAGEVLASLDNLLLVDRLLVIDSYSNRTAAWKTPLPPSGSGSYLNEQVRSQATSFSYSRTDSRASPVEISRVASLRYKPGLSAGHFVNGLALLQQLRR